LTAVPWIKVLPKTAKNIFIFMFFIVIIALLSMWLLYHDQNRHLAGIVEIERQLEKAERLPLSGNWRLEWRMKFVIL